MEQLLSFGIGLHLLQHDINVSPSLRVSSGVTRPALAALASHDQASGAVITWPRHLPLIGWGWSRDLDDDLWLADVSRVMIKPPEQFLHLSFAHHEHRQSAGNTRGPCCDNPGLMLLYLYSLDIFIVWGMFLEKIFANANDAMLRLMRS